jgi:hypothetical protein
MTFKRGQEPECRKCRSRHHYKEVDSRGRPATIYYCVQRDECAVEETRAGKEKADA